MTKRGPTGPLFLSATARAALTHGEGDVNLAGDVAGEVRECRLLEERDPEDLEGFLERVD